MNRRNFSTLTDCRRNSPPKLADLYSRLTPWVQAKLPSLAKEGWLRGSRESCEATLARADGVVRSSHRLSFRKLNEPLFLVSPYRAHIRSAHARPRLSKEGAIYLVARPPLLCQGGEFACTHGVKRVHT